MAPSGDVAKVVACLKVKAMHLEKFVGRSTHKSVAGAVNAAHSNNDALSAIVKPTVSIQGGIGHRSHSKNHGKFAVFWIFLLCLIFSPLDDLHLNVELL